MTDIKDRIAKNISELRLQNNMTQLELGERLNYSDKTISKWERGESTPDISVLIEIAELFGVTLDELVNADSIKSSGESALKEKTYNRRAISYISEVAAFGIAILAFVITTLISEEATFQWLYIVYAIPVALTVKLIFNSIWFNPRHNYFIISALMWSLLFTVHMTFFFFGISVIPIYLLGIFGQTVIILWSFIGRTKK
ncbi:MAG: helix-turn-helix transcriptional regulator [Clostridia bacterium]|nr:helix-turn-helix transcriptional regulator [Clostridia bacterium]